MKTRTHPTDHHVSLIKQLLEAIGEDPNRGGLTETPLRVAKAHLHWFGGYNESPKEVLKTFTDGAEQADQLVILKKVPFWSMCEHHMAPFFGTATVGYLPDKRIVGLSKIKRLVDIFARRLQVQERLTSEIAEALNEHLKPHGVAVVITARHSCMESRGVQCAGVETVTCAKRGLMHEDEKLWAEFLRLSE